MELEQTAEAQAMKRDDQLAFSAVAVTVCGLLAVVMIMVVAILKGMGI